MNIFKEKIAVQISQVAHNVYQKAKAEDKELTVGDIYEILNKNTYGKSGMNTEELCKKGGISKEEIKGYIFEGIKAPSIDNLA